MHKEKVAFIVFLIILVLAASPASHVFAQDFIQGCAGDCEARQQVIVNSGFEDGTTQGWQPFGNVTLTPTTAFANTGQFSLEVANRTASFNGPSFNLTDSVVNQQRIAASAFIFYTGGGDTETFRITVRRQVEGEADMFTNIAIQEVPRDQWTMLAGDFTLNVQGTLLDFLIYIECDNPTLTFYADDILITTPGTPCVQQNIPSVYKVYDDSFLIGSAVQLDALNGGLLTELLTMHFNSMTAEDDFKPINIAPEEGVFDFSRADQYVEFAEENNFYFRGHTLIWHQQVPDWFFVDENNQPVTREVLLARMENYIKTVVGRYRGRIEAWDVVNEAIDTSAPNNLRVTPWLELIGPDYIDKAFIFAHEADPDALLFYNDFNTTDPEKREAIFNLVKGLQRRGVPVEGIGMQGHISIFSPSVEEIEKTIQTFSQLNVQLQITELDMSIYRDASEPSFACAPQARLILQGLKYAALFRMFRKYDDVITNVTFWGLKDDLSWLNTFPVVRNAFPLLFDSTFTAKYAYWGVVAPKLLPTIILIDQAVCEIIHRSNRNNKN